MRDAIRRIVYVGFILVISLCLSSGGCKKKPAAGEKFGKVEGYAIDALDLTPIFGADILAGAPPDTALITETDSTGYYSFGDFATIREITADADFYQPQTKSVTIKENQTQRLDFLLEKEES